MAAVVKIQIETSGGVDAVKKDIEDLGSTAEKSGGGFNALKEIGVGALRAIGEMGVGLAIKGLQALAGAVQDGIADAQANAQIQAQTAAVLESTGNAAGKTAEQIADYASSLSDAAGASLFGDDQIQQSTNLLLTFTNIKGTVLDAATAISVDMAQAMGGAPKDAAIQLGKALNDPIKGITALTRVGVTFSDEQKAMIQAMVEAGDVAGAQGIILAELNKEFGGSAAAAAAATGGWSEFNGRLGEAKEALGAAVLPLLNQLASFLNTSILPAVESAAAAFGAWLADPAVQQGIQEIVTAIQSGLAVAFAVLTQQIIPDLLSAWATIQPAVSAVLPLFSGELPSSLQTTGATFTELQSTIDTVMQGIQAVVAAVLPQIAAFWQAHGAEIMAFIQETWNTIQSIIQTALRLIAAIVGPALQLLAGFISSHGEEIQTVLTNSWNAVKAVIDAALTLIQGILTAALQAIQGDWSGAWETIQTMSARIVEDLITIIQSGIGNLVTIFGGFVTNVLGILGGLVTGASAIGKSMIDGLVSAVEGAASRLWEAAKSVVIGALEAAKAAIGMGSPAKEWMPLGESMFQGVEVGAEKQAESTSNTIAAALSKITAAAKGSSSSTTNSSSSKSYTYSPTINTSSTVSDFLHSSVASSLAGV